MDIEEFAQDLPTNTKCDKCRKEIPDLDWGVSRFGIRDWMGMCVARCAQCRWVKVAAAGSSHEAHHRAQMMRWELVAGLRARGFA